MIVKLQSIISRCCNLLLFLFFTFLLSSCSPYPSDGRMIAEFYENEAEFKALFEQVKVWETRSWITPTNAPRLSAFIPPLSKAQAEEIQTQMADLGVYVISVDPELVHESDAFKVHMKTADEYDRNGELRQIDPSIRGKGYAYIEKPIPSASCVFDENLNRIGSAVSRVPCSGLIYRPIEGDWYLFLKGSESS